MSVVAWDGRIMAADRYAQWGNMVQTVQKLWENANIVYGMTGDLATCLAVSQFILGNKSWEDLHLDPEKYFGFVVFRKHSKVLQTFVRGSPIFVEEPLDKPLAMGIGEEFALGAMCAGASAVEAVKLCEGRIVGCGNGWDSVLCR